jgi:hypothetical protein
LFFIIITNINNYFLKQNNKKPKTFLEFINRGQTTIFSKKILLGFVFGMVFGFIDTISLWIGIDELQRYFPDGVLTKAAFSNIYADTLAVSISTAISVTLMEYFQKDLSEIPIWTNSLAIMIGCSLGLVAGRVFTNKK